MTALKLLLIKLSGIFIQRVKSLKSFAHASSGLIISYRKDSSDFQVYKQVIMEEEYKPMVELIDSQGNRDSIRNIVDAGANIGLTSLYFSRYFKNARILALEPNLDSFNVLKINTLFNGVKGKNIPKALWHTTKSLSSNRSFRDGKDWSFAVAENDAPSDDLQGISIQDLIKQFQFDTIDLLKIDIEGSEFEVFKGNLSFLDATKYIALEIHPEVGDPEIIYQSLKAHGFVLFTKGETCFGYNPQVLSQVQ